MSKSTSVFGTAIVMGAMAISLILPQAAFADVMDQWNRQSPGHGTSYSNDRTETRQTETAPQVRMLTGGTEPSVEVLGVRTRSASFSSDADLATSPLDQFLGQVQRESVHRVRTNAGPAIVSSQTPSVPYYPSNGHDHETSPIDQLIGHELR